MLVPTQIERPELTLPEPEAARVRAAFADAKVILEYGSGGSTVMAAEMPGKAIWSVESDPDWAEMMRGWFKQNPPATGSTVKMLHIDIGPTKEWGKPVGDSGWTRYAEYPLAVWEREKIPHPDAILVDGRFRVGCALAAAYKITRPIPLFLDDFVGRDRYAQITEFLGQPEIVGRMAIFQLEPLALPVDRLLTVIRYMTRR